MFQRTVARAFFSSLLAVAAFDAQAAAPTCANSIPDQTWSGSGPKTLQIRDTTFLDADFDDLTFTAKRLTGLALPAWLSFNATTLTLSGNPPVGEAKLSLKLTANDGHDGTAVCAFSLNLSNVNDAPTLATPLVDQSWSRGSAQSFQIPATAFTDADGDALTYSATLDDGSALPSWLTFAPATRTLSGTPPTGASSMIIKITASDGQSGTASDQFILSFTTAANRAPTVASPIADRTWSGSGSKSFRVPIGTFADRDGDTLTYSATLSDGSALPSWLRFSRTTRQFSGNPPSGLTSLRVKVRASDGKGGSASDSFVLSFSNTNDAPTVATTIADQSWSGRFQVPASTFSDGDGNSLTYSARLADGSALPSWLSFSPATRTFSGTAPSSGADLEVRVTASDGRGGNNSTTFRLAAEGTNQAPVASNGTLTVSRDTAGTGTLRATDADAEDALIYRVVTNGTKGTATITNASTGEYRYTPNSGATGTDTFTFKANDGTVDSSLATITVTINAVAQELTNTLGMTFKRIPSGTFTMGASSDDLNTDSWFSHARPQHQVTISRAFYMQTTEITQGQWREVMGSNPSYFSSCGDTCPVEQVSWNDLQDFISRLNSRGEGTYRLPTEAEWEYAARAGTTTAYSFGSSDSNINQYAWSYSNSSSTTHPVAQKLPNAWGLYDMHGNVWEWVADYWSDSFTSSAVTDPQGPSSGSGRVIRGGGWGSDPVYLRSAFRGDYDPGYRNLDFGARVLRTSP
ncbi:MAG: SUMF1/EgtB/PvdO family nonheme iron enzyme [Magnetococcales bacterium]|nr:SUMF1/EgtB/PvdO family nonheme iron enzyme [Magnetococcales bacterium]